MQRKQRFLLSPEHGQYPVGRHTRNRFLPLEVIPVLGCRLFLTRSHRRRKNSLVPKQLPNCPPRCGVLADPFGDYVPSAAQGVLDIVYLSVGVHVLCSSQADVKSSWLRIYRARGANPFSRAMAARVRRLGLKGKYTSSKAAKDSAERTA